MNTETTTPAQGAIQVDADVCRHTGLSRPECHCQDCLRDLVARFRPTRDS